MSQRAQPFYCPYCAEQSIEPAEGGAATWYCSSCDRRFDVHFVGLGQTDPISE